MNWRDGQNFLRKVTIKKVFNAAKVFLSYKISKTTGKLFHKGLPISISIEPTTSCNLRCPECPSGLRSFTRPTGMLNLTLFRKIIDQMKDHVIYLTLYFQGEPYLNPDFLNMVKYASSNKIYTSTSTNAHYLSDESAKKTVESGLDRLIISIDGTTQEVYEVYRKGGKLDKVIEGTEKILKWKKALKSSTPHIIFQFLVVKANEDQVEEVNKLAGILGVDEVVLKTAQIYDYENGSELIPEKDKYSRYKQTNNGKWVLKNKLENSCWKMWQSCVFTWDGKVLPCCFDKDGQFQLGDMKTDAFDSIWNNDKYKAFRKSILNSRKEIEICKNCTEGTKVWA
ncbi:MAG TPA: radical SAM/SPASM domain-containing protein [Cytophagales bacterium]|nr:radical SAM/SPASM domain-containing protein [Cytophagales bacterium]